MHHRFNPNTNPIADDLLRLSMAPATRFSPPERRALASILAAKLYRLKSFYDDFIPFARMRHSDKNGAYDVVIDVLFDADSAIRRRALFYSRAAGLKVIVVSVGENGVVELFNGSWDSSSHKTVSIALNQMREGGTEENMLDEQGSDAVPIRSDDEIRGDYLGESFEDRDRGAEEGDGNGGQRGGGGGNEGGGGDGANEGPGAGGTAEVLNHPILFSIDQNTFNAILDQT